MSRFSNFFLGMFVGALSLYLTMQYYVVRSGDGVHLVSKLSPKLELPYFDIRAYNLNDWQKHSDLTLAMLKANKGGIMKDFTLGNFKQAANIQTEQTGDEKTNGWGW